MIPVELSILAGSSVSFGEAQMSPMYCGLVKTTKKNGWSKKLKSWRSWRTEIPRTKKTGVEKKKSGMSFSGYYFGPDFSGISFFFTKKRYSGIIHLRLCSTAPARLWILARLSLVPPVAGFVESRCRQDGSNKNLDGKLTSKWVKNQRSLKFKKAEFVQKSHHQCWRKLCKTKHYMSYGQNLVHGEGTS